MLTKEECHKIHVQNAGKLVWLDWLAENDQRLLLTNADEILHCFYSAEWDKEEQAQAARLCAAVNAQRRHFGGVGAVGDNASPVEAKTNDKLIHGEQ